MRWPRRLKPIKTDAEALMECTVRPRRVVLNFAEASLMVLEPGDPAALHHGSTGLVAVAVAIKDGT